MFSGRLRCPKTLRDSGEAESELFPKYNRGGDGEHPCHLIHSPAVSARFSVTFKPGLILFIPVALM